MATYSKISQMVNGVLRSVDLGASGNFLWVDALKVGSGEVQLTGSALTSLLTLISGGDAGAAHNHDGAYYTKAEVDSQISAIDLSSRVAIDGSSTMTGSLDMGSQHINNVLDPMNPQDAATKNYADTKLALDGSSLMTGSLDMGGNAIVGLADPTTSSDGATKNYVDTQVQQYVQGAKPKQSVLVASTANVNMVGSVFIDDVIASGARVLLKNQTDPTQNGIWISGVGMDGSWTRAEDFDQLSPVDEVNGAWVGVQEGTVNGGKVFIQYGTVNTIGTDPINFSYFNDLSSLSGGDMVTLLGGDISVDLATNGGLESSNPGNTAGKLRAKVDASTGLNLSAAGIGITAGGITATQLATASVTSAKLNSSVVDSTGGLEFNGGALRVDFSPTSKKAYYTEALASSGLYCIRFSLDGEGSSEARPGTTDTSAGDKFHIMGLYYEPSTSGTSWKQVVHSGLYYIGAEVFAATDIGKAVYLGSDGKVTLIPPTTAGHAVVKVGMVRDSYSILVQIQIMGIN